MNLCGNVKAFYHNTQIAFSINRIYFRSLEDLFGLTGDDSMSFTRTTRGKVMNAGTHTNTRAAIQSEINS